MDSDIDPIDANTTWAIGDVHGCIHTLESILEQIESIDSRPRYLFVGDLVGKGPYSLEVLQRVHQFGDRSEVVLGNHDLHLLAVSHNVTQPRTGDQLDPVLTCLDWDWRGWLESRPLVHVAHPDGDRPWIMTHAGIHPHWSVEDTIGNGEILSDAIRHGHWDWYRNKSTPIGWAAEILTRMRALSPEGVPLLEYTGKLAGIPEPDRAWFDFPGKSGQSHDTVSGHWATLGYHQRGPHHCIDGGCVYGGSLLALRLEDKKLLQVARFPQDAADRS